jgi:tripartite-type tricarboxylate transporter receptor subunit TctC
VKILQDTKKFYRRLVFVYYILKETPMSIKKILIAALLLPTLALAWQPTKPISVIIPFNPGSGNEMAFRSVIAPLERQGFNFIIEHRPGADGNVGMNQFAQRSADGHAIAVPSCQSTFVAADIHYKNMITYDPMSLTMITNIGKSPLAFVASSKSRVNTVDQLVQEVRSGTRDINFAIGSAAHQLAFDYFVDQTGANSARVKSVPHNGPLPAVTATAGNHIEFAIVPTAVANTLLPSGKIKILGIAGQQRLPAFPTTARMTDSVPGLNVYACWNVVLPQGAAPEVVKWYTDNFVAAVNSEQYRAWAAANMVSIDKNAQGPDLLRQDMMALRTQWQSYTAKQPGPNK